VGCFHRRAPIISKHGGASVAIGYFRPLLPYCCMSGTRRLRFVYTMAEKGARRRYSETTRFMTLARTRSS
jgi:hypothetical protein